MRTMHTHRDVGIDERQSQGKVGVDRLVIHGIRDIHLWLGTLSHALLHARMYLTYTRQDCRLSVSHRVSYACYKVCKTRAILPQHKRSHVPRSSPKQRSHVPHSTSSLGQKRLPWTYLRFSKHNAVLFGLKTDEACVEAHEAQLLADHIAVWQGLGTRAELAPTLVCVCLHTYRYTCLCTYIWPSWRIFGN